MIQISTVLYCGYDRGKIVICQDHVGGIFCDFGACAAHSYTDICLFFLLREDLLKLNNISQEVRLLARHQIDTAEQLALYKKEQEVNIRELSAKRRVLQNALRTKAVRDSPKQADAHRAQIRELSERLKALRREVHLCDDIAERSGVMAEKLKAVREDAQKQRQKEEQQHEHIRRRS